MSYFKIGLHAAGVGGNYDGFGDYVQACKDASRPCIVQAVDNAGPAYAVQELGRDTMDVIVFRMTSRSGQNLDRVPYTGDPIEFAGYRMAQIERYWPPELIRSIVWTAPVNEPSKEPGDIEWLAAFTFACGRLSVANGWRHLACGWSTGTPEPGYWQLPDSLDYLRLCSQHPDKLGVSLHEYSLSEDLQNQYPFLIGRFQALHQVCDENNIARPPIIIGEFGGREASLKLGDTFSQQMTWAADLYAAHSNILGAALWTEGYWHGSIASDVSGYIPELIGLMRNYEYDEPIDPPPPPGDNLLQRLWNASVEEQIARGIPLNPDAGIQRAIFNAGLVPVHRERTVEGITIQAAESLNGRIPRRVYTWQPGLEVDWFDESHIDDEPIDPPPPADDLIDLRRFMVADAHCWRVVRHPSGAQEDIRDMDLGGGLYVRAKNSLGEWWRYDGDYAYLIHDTSPAPGGQGIQRVYTITKGGNSGAPKNPLQMRLGHQWYESGSHHVQFKAKNGCQPLAENSGNATNGAVITRYETNYTFNGFGQGLTFDEVVWIRTGNETQIYGRQNGRSCGWIGWSSPWGFSEPVEIHWDRGVLRTEPPRYCGW